MAAREGFCTADAKNSGPNGRSPAPFPPTVLSRAVIPHEDPRSRRYEPTQGRLGATRPPDSAWNKRTASPVEPRGPGAMRSAPCAPPTLSTLASPAIIHRLWSSIPKTSTRQRRPDRRPAWGPQRHGSRGAAETSPDGRWPCLPTTRRRGSARLSRVSFAPRPIRTGHSSCRPP